MPTRTDSASIRRRRAPGRRPLNVNITFDVRFGDRPQDRIRLMDHTDMPLVGTVFDYRSRIIESFTRSLMRAALRHPDTYRALVPAWTRLWPWPGSATDGRRRS